MAAVQREIWQAAWSVVRQTTFGTALLKTDLLKYVKFADPILIDESAEHWSDRGMAGMGHVWETTRAKNRQMVTIEIPVQPMSTDFAGYLIAMFFSTVSTVDNRSEEH